MKQKQVTKRSLLILVLCLSSSQYIWADTNPYASFTTGSSSSGSVNPLVMMQGSPGGQQSSTNTEASNAQTQAQSAPVYSPSSSPIAAPAAVAAPQYVQAPALVQPAQNLGKTTQPVPTSSRPPSSAAVHGAAPAQPAVSQGLSLNAAVAKKFIAHDTGFNALYPVLGAQNGMNQGRKNFVPLGYIKSFQGGTSSQVSSVMPVIQLFFSSAAQFFQGDGEGVSPSSVINTAVLAPFQDPNWMINLQGASAEQVLKVIAVQGAIQNYLLNQILQREYHAELLQTAEVRSVYDLIDTVQAQQKQVADQQKESLKILRAILATEQSKAGHGK